MQLALRGLAMAGARAWLVTVTDGARRSTPTGVRLAGVGCVWTIRPWLLDEARLGPRHRNGEPQLLLDHGTRRWAPQGPGWSVCPRTACCSYPQGPTTAWSTGARTRLARRSSRKKPTLLRAHCFHVALAVDSWKAHVGEAQLRAMTTMNKETCDAKVSSTMCTERKSFYTHHM